MPSHARPRRGAAFLPAPSSSHHQRRARRRVCPRPSCQVHGGEGRPAGSQTTCDSARASPHDDLHPASLSTSASVCMPGAIRCTFFGLKSLGSCSSSCPRTRVRRIIPAYSQRPVHLGQLPRCSTIFNYRAPLHRLGGSPSPQGVGRKRGSALLLDNATYSHDRHGNVVANTFSVPSRPTCPMIKESEASAHHNSALLPDGRLLPASQSTEGRR